jgi:hypothetical protein
MPGKPHRDLMFMDLSKKMIADPDDRNTLSPINGLEEQINAAGDKHLVPAAL